MSSAIPHALAFLADLEANNNRPFFEANRERYERELREPALAFVRAMGERLDAVSPHLVADDRNVGGSLMRIYRDTRFSNDKRPYKTNVGLRFYHPDSADVHAPGLYMHIALDGCFLGAGNWHPEPEPLRAFRDAIVARPDEWRAATSGAPFAPHWKLSGDSLKRIPRGYPADHAFADDLRRKDFIAIAELPTDWLSHDDLADRVIDRFAGATPLLRFLSHAVGAPI